MKTIILLVLLSFSSIFGYSQNDDMKAYKIFDSKGNEVSYNDMINGVKDADMVFFGELHNNSIAHWMEFNVAKSLFAIKKGDFIMGAEMFESDNQLIIDEYLNDLISEKKYKAECRLWPNYDTDYEPIVKFAKMNKIPFIATNIPRRYASVVYKKDFDGLNKLSEQAKKYIAPLPIKFDPNVECYKKMIDGMGGMGNSGGTTIAKAQAAKDATMAHFILQNYQKGNLFFHFNGSYHSDNLQGICWYIQQANKKYKIKLITTVVQDDISVLEEESQSLADFIICVPSDMTNTY